MDLHLEAEAEEEAEEAEEDEVDETKDSGAGGVLVPTTEAVAVVVAAEEGAEEGE